MDEETLLQTLKAIRRSEKFKEFIAFLDSGSRGIYVILRYLKDNENRDVVAGDLAKEMGVTTARVARALKTLEKKGYVERKKIDEDGRKVSVVLTSGGEVALKKREKDIRLTILPWLNRLSEKEQNELIELLQKILQ